MTVMAVGLALILVGWLTAAWNEWDGSTGEWTGNVLMLAGVTVWTFGLVTWSG